MKNYLAFVALVFAISFASPAWPDVTETVNGPFNIPDDDFNGVNILVDVAANETISDVELIIGGLEHTRASDLTILLTAPAPNSGSFLSAISSPRFGESGGDANFSGDYTFSDDGGDLWSVMAPLGTNDTIATGDYFASLNDGSPGDGFATTFGGLSTVGTWEINISDSSDGEIGSLEFVTLNFTSTAVPEPGAMAVLGLGGLILIARRRRASHA